MVYELGYHLSEIEFELAIKILDKDGDKEISYSEFQVWWINEDRFKKLQLSEEKQAQLKACSDFFQAFDEDGNGVLDSTEFVRCHENLVAVGITTETCQKLMANIDTDNDGTVSFNEYISWLIDHNKLHLAPGSDAIVPLAAATEAETPGVEAAAVAGTPEASTPEAAAPVAATPTPAAAATPSAVENFHAKSQIFAQQAAAAAEELRLRRLKRAQELAK